MAPCWLAGMDRLPEESAWAAACSLAPWSLTLPSQGFFGHTSFKDCGGIELCRQALASIICNSGHENTGKHFSCFRFPIYPWRMSRKFVMARNN
jgi:hypothetical protein